MAISDLYKGTPSNYVSPLAVGTSLQIAPSTDIWNLPNNSIGVIFNGPFDREPITLTLNGSVVYSGTGGDSVQLLTSGTYVLNYKCYYTQIRSGSDGPSYNEYSYQVLTFAFAVVENYLPLKKWTITDVINRLLQLERPIRQGETPRYTFNAEQAALFDNILAPQFSFTKQTLRECLQEVGSVVHGEPRLKIMQDESGEYYYEIVYDLYASTKKSGVYTRPYIKESVKQVIEQYCSNIDSSAENLVNALQESVGGYLRGRNGVITEPYNGGYKTTRCDTLYSRITEDNMLIQTQLPIYSISKLECGIIPDNTTVGTDTEEITRTVAATKVNYSGSFLAVLNGEMITNVVAIAEWIAGGSGDLAVTTSINVTPTGTYVNYTLNNTSIGVIKLTATLTIFESIDLTPYVFESSVYNTQLSSYDSAYPYSKAYGITYTQGENNITALNFKQEDPISSIFKNYAIVNILKEITGKSISISGQDYPLLAFRVTYTPIYSTRVEQSKVYYKDTPRGSALIYNQQSNIIESRAYGENIKGIVARLGNVEITKTYHFARIGYIPEAGQLYDDDYYISAVYVEIYRNLITCTIGLSKDFNRLSQYIGISSVKRFSEVSQTQAQDRNVLYRDYVVIGEPETPDSDSIIGDNLMAAIASTFTLSQEFVPLTNVVAWGTSAKDNNLPVAQLPVICSAFGNSMSFTWSYEDNYSAGAISQYQTSTSTSGYFQNNYQYTDYYGKIYYYNFDLQPCGTQPQTYDEQTEIGLALPQYGDGTTPPTSSSGYLSTIGLAPYVMRKDNRERIKVTAQVDFLTNIKSLIVGSALAANNPLIGGAGIITAKLYVFTEKLDKFINHLSGSVNVDFVDNTIGDYTFQTPDLPNADLVTTLSDGAFTLNVEGGVFPGVAGTQYKAWAIVSIQLSETEEVEDETGQSTSQTVQYGGDVLLAQNIDFSAGDTFSPIYFTKKREVYDNSVWKQPL